jgi:hypothetical protein
MVVLDVPEALLDRGGISQVDVGTATSFTCLLAVIELMSAPAMLEARRLAW